MRAKQKVRNIFPILLRLRKMIDEGVIAKDANRYSFEIVVSSNGEWEDGQFPFSTRFLLEKENKLIATRCCLIDLNKPWDEDISVVVLSTPSRASVKRAKMHSLVTRKKSTPIATVSSRTFER